MAITRLVCALREFPILGVRTNIAFLLRVLEHPRFLAGTSTPASSTTRARRSRPAGRRNTLVRSRGRQGARIGMFEALGYRKPQLLEAFDIAGFPVVDVRSSFRIPSKFGDDVVIL